MIPYYQSRLNIYVIVGLMFAFIIASSMGMNVQAATSSNYTSITESKYATIQASGRRVEVIYQIGSWFVWDNAKLLSEASGTNPIVTISYKDNQASGGFITTTTKKVGSNQFARAYYTSSHAMYLHPGSYGEARNSIDTVILALHS